MPPLSPPQPDTASRGPATKRCSHCHSEQPLEAFRHNQRAPDGRAWACRTCMSQQARARYIQRKIGAGAPVDADWDRPIDRAREKRCSHCRQVKPLDAFGVDRSRRSGRRSWCRACGRARVDAHRRARGLPELERDVVIDHTREKRCSRCREIKPLSAFHHNRSQTGGRYAYCRDCVSARYQEGVRAAGSPVVPSAPVVHPGADGGTDGRMSDTDQTRPIDRTREKRCGRCRETKPLSAFRRNRSMRDGRHGYCRACDAARYREARIPARTRNADRRRERRCYRCGQPKPFSAFPPNRNDPSRPATVCIACHIRRAAGQTVDVDWDRPIDRTREKRCGHCWQVQPLVAFRVDRSRPDGRRSWCRACLTEQRNARIDARRRARGLPTRDRTRIIDRTREKRCSRCYEVKPHDAFSRDRSQSDGRLTYCRPCAAARYQAAKRRAQSRQMVASAD